MIFSFNEKYTIEQQLEIVRKIRYEQSSCDSTRIVYNFMYTIRSLLHPVVSDSIVVSELCKDVTSTNDMSVICISISNEYCATYLCGTINYPEFDFRHPKYKFLFSTNLFWCCYDPVFRKRGAKFINARDISNVKFNELHLLTAAVEVLGL